jgi:hypothetical protein
MVLLFNVFSSWMLPVTIYGGQPNYELVSEITLPFLFGWETDGSRAVMSLPQRSRVCAYIQCRVRAQSPEQTGARWAWCLRRSVFVAAECVQYIPLADSLVHANGITVLRLIPPMTVPLAFQLPVEF